MLFEILPDFDFDSICVKKDSNEETETKKWIGKHVPISASSSSSSIQEPIFLCNTNFHHLVSAFISAPEDIATQGKSQMKMKVIETEAENKMKLCKLLEKLYQRYNREETVMDFVLDFIFDTEEQDLCTQFLQLQKNQLTDLCYCNVLSVFGFNSAKHDLNLIKSFSLPILVNEQDIEPTVIRGLIKVFFQNNFGGIQLLDIINFPGGDTNLDSFLKAYKTNQIKGFFSYEWFDCTEKLNTKKVTWYDSLFNILRNGKPLEKNCNDFENLVKSCLSREQAVVKLEMNNVPPTGADNHASLEYLEQRAYATFCGFFFQWYNNKIVVPRLEPMHKMIDFYNNNGVDKLNIWCILQNLAIICLHKPRVSKFYLFTEKDKVLLEKKR